MNFRLLILSALSTLTIWADDVVELESGDRFVGKVTGMDEDRILLKTQYREEALEIHSNQLSRLTLEGDVAQELPTSSTVFRLRNGDSFPGTLLNLTSDQLLIKTWFAGELTIDRTAIASIQCNAHPQKFLYPELAQGPEWTPSDEGSWRFADKALLSVSRGIIGQQFPLPESYLLKLNLESSSKLNLRIHLGASEARLEGDRYLIEISGDTLTLKRVALTPEGKEKTKILAEFADYSTALQRRSPNSLPLEVFLDRERRLIQIYLDGQRIAPGYDDLVPPSGQFIIFESLTSSRGHNKISTLQILEWDPQLQRLREEEPTNKKIDSVTVADGDRYLGELLSSSGSDSELSFLVKTKLSPEPVEIPLQHCAVIHFSESERPILKTAPFMIDLLPRGRLTLSPKEMKPTQINAKHPLMGQLQIDRQAIGALYQPQK